MTVCLYVRKYACVCVCVRVCACVCVRLRMHVRVDVCGLRAWSTRAQRGQLCRRRAFRMRAGDAKRGPGARPPVKCK